jgi:hypothetical protein
MQANNDFVRFAGRLTPEDMSIIDAARRKLGIRSVTETLRVALRSLAREHALTVKQPEQAENA